MARVEAEKLYAVIHDLEGGEEKLPLEWTLEGDVLYTAFPDLADWSRVKAIDYAPEMGRARAGEAGYYVIPHGEHVPSGDSFLCRFRERKDIQTLSWGFIMPMWGCVSPRESFTAIVTSMTYEYSLVTSVQRGEYANYPRFELAGEAPYEPIRVEYHLLTGERPDYNDVAIAYRRWRERRGDIQLLKNRAARRPAAAYTAHSIYVRVRQGWKPVPPPVMEQTPETEPPMRVAATFADVSALLDCFRAHHIPKAEFCLVGWNVKGHDGRWPQAFPVEEALGGESALKALTAKAREMGYAMVCHTNSTDAYSIADCWTETDILADRQGKPVKNDQPWSGGAMYQVCPWCGLRQAREILPRVAEMGFAGTHYIDVIATVFPRTCHDPRHPATKRQTVALWNRIFRLSRHLFGGVSSEGVFDFAAPELDYGLYVSFGRKEFDLIDDCVPLWQLVYHGYILSNPYSDTVNPNAQNLLKLAEYGGRPTFYYDSKFVTPQEGKNVNWMGEDDFHCHTAEEREESAAYIAQAAAWYERIKYLQFQRMEKHEDLGGGRRRVRYENGDEILVDYSRGEAFLNGDKILPLS